MSVARRRAIIALACLGIFGAALAVRVYDLERTPPGLYFDEAIKGVDASRAIDFGEYKWLYPDNNAREGLFMNIQTLSVRAFGHEAWALRLPAAVLGAAAVVGIFLLAYLMFPGTLGILAGSAAAAMAGFGYWHVHLSRVGLRAPIVGLVVIWFLVLLLAALRRYRGPTKAVGWRGYAWWAAAGAACGLGLHTYPTYRGAGLILVVAIAGSYYLIGNRRDWLLGWTVFAVGGLVTAAPMLLHYYEYQHHLLAREEITVWKAPDPLAAWWDGVKKTAMMFTGPGDCNARFNFPCRAQLHPATAGLAGVGLLVCLAGLFRRPTDGWRRLSSGLLLVGLVGMLVPVTLTTDGLPQALRASAAAPFAYLLAGLGAAVLGQWLYRWRTVVALRAAAVAALVAAILWAAVADTRLYFDKFPKRAETGPAFTWSLSKQASFVGSRPGRHYLVVEPDGAREDGLSVAAAVSQFLLWDEWRSGQLVYVLAEEARRLHVQKPATVGVLTITAVPRGFRADLMAKLESRYPDGSVISGPGDERYFVR